MGMSVQHDGLLGTNLLFTVGYSFPNHRPRRDRKENETNLPRLVDAVQRQPTIAVTNDVETDINTAIQTEVVARNPETGQPWIFQHVTLGAVGGDGNFENPFGTVQAALNAAASDGNHIAYVDIGNNADIPGFSIPDRVQVLSRGPVQPLDTIQFDNIQIPLSGTGQFPTIRGTTATNGALNGLVSLGDRSTLSGFEIQANGSNGVVGNDVVDAIVRDNRIFNADRGIYIQGDGVTSGAMLLRNTINGAAQQGILFEAINGGAIANTVINSNIISNSTVDGIRITAADNSALTNIAVSRNTIQNVLNPAATLEFADGIDIFVSSGSTAENITISENIIDNVADDGINIGVRHIPTIGSHISNVVISNNQISNIGSDTYACGTGIEVFNNGSDAVVIEGISITNNTISNARHGSILFDSTNVSNVPAPNPGGIFRVTNFTGNTSINPGNGVDLGFFLGNNPVTGASVEFSGIGTVQPPPPVNPVVSAAIQASNNFAGTITQRTSTNRNGVCPMP